MISDSLLLLQQSAMPELNGLVTTLIGGLSFLGIFLGVMFFVITVVWVILPFGVIGIKRRLDNIAQWQQAIFEELRKINETLSRGDDPQ
jgi:hypothetical protein